MKNTQPPNNIIDLADYIQKPIKRSSRQLPLFPTIAKHPDEQSQMELCVNGFIIVDGLKLPTLCNGFLNSIDKNLGARHE